MFNEDQTIGTDAKSAVTKPLYQAGIVFGERATAVVNHDEIVAGALVFVKVDLHFGFDNNIKNSRRGRC